jgi:hypothetical protein
MPEPEDFSADLNDAGLNDAGLNDRGTNMNGLSADDRNLERLLKSLVPRESRLNRDRVMYLAGQASADIAKRSSPRPLARWMWLATTVCAACAGLIIGAVLSLRNPIAGNPIVGNSVGIERSRDVHEAPTGAGKLPDGPGANKSSSPQIAARPAAEGQRPGLSTDLRTAGSLHAVVASNFPLLVIRDRMAGNHWDDQALAQMDWSTASGDPATSDDSTTEIEKPLGARELFERWIEDEGPEAHRGP